MITRSPARRWLLLLAQLFCLPLLMAQSAALEKATASLRPDIVVAGAPLWSLSERMVHYNVPGVSVAVVQDFKLVNAGAYGKIQAKLPDQPTTETAFQAASISKLVNAIGVMKLVEAGKLDLDRDINKILTTWQLPPSPQYPSDTVTMRMLLSHTAGLSAHGFGGYRNAEGLPSITEILDKALEVNSDAVRVIQRPGESFKYSGGGTVITQLIVEELSGIPYEQYMQETVLLPLGMTNSFYSVNQQAQDRALATAHWANGKPLKNSYQYYPESAAAGLWTTPTDLGRVMIDLMLAFKGEAGRLLRPATARAMLIPPNDGENNALGLFLEDKNGQIYFNHGGSNEGFKANFIGSTTAGYGAVIMHNGEQFDLIPEILNGIATAYAWPDWFNPANTIPTDFRVDKSGWKALTGQYVNEADPSNAFAISTKKGKLMMSRPKAWNLELIATTKSTYLLKGASPQVCVEFLADGRLKVTQGEVSYYRKE